MDMTAVVRAKVSLLASHSVGSGNVSKNHSWNTGGKLNNRQPTAKGLLIKLPW